MKSFIIVLLYIFTLIQAGYVQAVYGNSNQKKSKFRGGKIYEINTDKKNLLFTISAELKKPKKNISIFISSYIDTEKNEVMSEEAHFLNFSLQKYVINQKQLNEIYELEISDGKMHFFKTKEGEIQEKTKILPPNLVVGPSFVPFLQANWPDIQNKKVVEFELAVLDYMTTLSFEFEKLRDEKYDGKDAILVRMKAANTLVASVVRPVYFLVKNDGSQIFEIKGRMLPKRKVGLRLEDFEGEAVFTY